MNNKTFLILMALSAAFFDCQAASENNIKRGQGVLKRARADYKPVGMRLGSFKLLPTLDLDNEWKDNIFFSQSGLVEDFIFHVQPGFALQSDWKRHALGFVFDGDFQTYADRGSEDKENYSFTLDGKLDVVRNSFAHAKLLYANQFENRGIATSVFDNGAIARNPTSFQTLQGLVGYEHKVNRIRLNLINDASSLNFDNVLLFNGDTIDNDKNRSRMRNETSFRFGYEINPQYEAFFKTAYNFIDYDSETGADGFQRSSDGYENVVGVALDLTGKLTGNIYLGYVTQDYQDPRLISVSGLTGGLGLKWSPTGLTSVNANIDRGITETIQGDSSAVFGTNFTVGVDHELLRHIILSAAVGYTNNEFQGGQGRNEDIFNFGFNAKYFVNRNLYLKTGYRTESRTANIQNTNYDLNSLYLTIGSQL
jgi:hypothetical protein